MHEFSSRKPQTFLKGNYCWEGCSYESCFYWASDDASIQTTSPSSSTTNRVGSTIASSFRITFPYRYPSSSWILLLIPGSSDVCDTTSHLYGIGKGVALKQFHTNSNFREQAKVFDTDSASIKDVVKAGENALMCLYKGNHREDLNSLRYKRFCEKAATSTSHVQPQSLPPTSSAAKYHSLRVYYQIQDWKGFGDKIRPEEWEWIKMKEFVPIQTDLAPAPQKL